MNKAVLLVAGTVLALSSTVTTQPYATSLEQDKKALVQAIHAFGMKLYDQVGATGGNSCL